MEPFRPTVCTNTTVGRALVPEATLNLSARQRVLETAYALLSRRGVRDVGVNEIIERADVAKATFYHHFPSKEHLVLAVLDLREQRWTLGWVGEAKKRGATAEEQLLAIFDIFDEWFHREDFEGCLFVNVLLEMGSEHAAGAASARHLEKVRQVVRRLAKDAGLRDRSAFAHSWHILMNGSVVAAGEGDLDAAQRAKAMARHLLEAHR